jgi:hypothetical protein
MEINILKEQILEIKLKLHKIQLEKNTAAKHQHYERAADLRAQEKQLKEDFGILKSEVLKEMEKSRDEYGDITDYAEFQSLVFEFHPIDFLNDTKQAKSVEAIDNYIHNYWKIRDQMHDDLMKYLFEEYKYLREQIQIFKSDSDEVNAQKALQRLASISDLIHRHKP